MKPPIIAILTIAITAFVWNRSVAAQVEHKSTRKAGSMSANASCYEKSTGRLVGANKSVTSVLAIAQAISRAQGGHIECHTKLGTGSTFTVVLPDVYF